MPNIVNGKAKTGALISGFLASALKTLIIVIVGVVLLFPQALYYNVVLCP